MKLHTSIAPRRDGTVRATSQDGTAFVFAPGPDGELACDVTDEALVVRLLATEQFWPADASDFDSAAALFEPPNPDADKDQDPGDDEPGDDDGDDEAEPNMDAMPVEAKTAPVAKPPKKVGAKPKTK